MVDVNFGPEPGPRPHLTDPREAYLHMVRRKRMYGGILGVLFVEFLPSLTETINIAAVSALLGALPAAALALLATRGLARWPRAIPEIVVALVLICIPGGGPLPAVIAIALHTGGALGKLFSEVAENADLKPVEGLASVGATWGQRMWLGVIPQVAPNGLSYAMLRFEVNVRAGAILGFGGEGGIGHDLKLAMQWGQGRHDKVVAIFLLLSDFWSHKTHATRDNRSGKLTIATGGDAKGTWPPGMKPDWVGKATASPPSIWGRVIW